MDERAQLRAQRANRVYGGDEIAAVDEVLTLDLVAVARREPDPEVRQPVVGRSGVAELLCGIDGIHAGNRMRSPGRRAGTEHVRRWW